MKIKDCVLIEAFKCNKDNSVVEVAKKLKHLTLRHIFVVDDKNYPVGVISMSDINNRVVAENKNAAELKAEDIMSNPIDVCDENDDAGIFMKKLIEKGHVMAPVVKEKQMAGIVTITQLLKCHKKGKNE
jgi:CBS domain-containing protein